MYIYTHTHIYIYMWKIKKHLPFSSLIFPLKPPYTEAFGREKGGRACADVLAEFARGVVKKWRFNDRSGIGNTRGKPWTNMVYSLKNHGNTSMKLCIWVSKWCIASK
jgi:hypothetical protein